MIGSTSSGLLTRPRWRLVGSRHLRDGDHLSFAKCDVAKASTVALFALMFGVATVMLVLADRIARRSPRPVIFSEKKPK